jgi:outer membrane protein assembly factor BamB
MRWLFAFVLVCGASVFAEDYLTEGVDNGRTGWLKNEKVFTTANVGSMKLLWKIKVNSTPRQMHNLFAPLTVSGVTTARGARELAIFSGISDELYAVDVATGEMIWEKKFESIYPSVTTGVGSTFVSRRADGRSGHHHDSHEG